MFTRREDPYEENDDVPQTRRSLGPTQHGSRQLGLKRWIGATAVTATGPRDALRGHIDHAPWQSRVCNPSVSAAPSGAIELIRVLQPVVYFAAVDCIALNMQEHDLVVEPHSKPTGIIGMQFPSELWAVSALLQR